jgi:AcrR family transcriptional regulator
MTAPKPRFGATKPDHGTVLSRQNERVRTRTRDDVVKAAGRLFAARGYHGTSMRDLAGELGLLGSSLYSHIDSKEDLLVEVVQRGAAFFQESADGAMTGEATGGDRLARLVKGHIDVVLDHLDEVRTFLYEADQLDHSHRRRIVRARDRYEAAFREALTQGAADGSLRSDLDPKMATIFLLSVLNALERWYRPGGALSRQDLVEEVMAYALNGLAG